MILGYSKACFLVMRIYPEFSIYDLPKMKFHGTMKVNLAYCHFARNEIIVSKKHYEKNKIVFDREIFLHELAHFVAYKKHGCLDHSRHWQNICMKLGIPARKTIEVTL